VGHVARIEEKNAYQILLESLKGRDHLEDLGVDGRIILKWTLGKQYLGVWIGFIWFRVGINDRLL
jgi:hypothetical protein